MKSTKNIFIICVFFLGNTISYAQNLEDSLKAFYTFNGNSLDQSGYNHDGTLMGGATYTLDRFNNPNSSLLLDGINDYVDIIATNELRPTDFPVTICAWVKPSSTMTSTGIIFASSPLMNQYGGQWLQVNTVIPEEVSASYGIANGATGSSSRKTKRAETTVCDDNWHFISAVYNGIGDIEIMVDCDYPNTFYNGSLSTGFTYETLMKAVIGKAELVSQSAEYFKGAIDDVRFYNRALSQNELSQLCDLTAGIISDNEQNNDSEIHFSTLGNNLEIITTNNFSDDSYVIEIIDFTGRSIWKTNQMISAGSKYSFLVEDIPNGQYLIRYTGKISENSTRISFLR